MPPISVAIVDNNDIYRFGCKALFETDGRFALAASLTGLDALAPSHSIHGLNVVLLDPVVRGEIARGVVKRATDCFPGASILIITDSLVRDAAILFIEEGAASVLLKSRTSGDQILAAVSLLAKRGLIILDESIALPDLRSLSTLFPALNDHLVDLSGRELEVLRLLSQGFTDTEIALRLSLATTTIYTHVGSICNKLRVRNRVQLGAIAARSGLLNPTDDSGLSRRAA